jgi:hypothetical protein
MDPVKFEGSLPQRAMCSGSHETVRGGANQDGSGRTAQWTIGIQGAYGVCVSVHELPGILFFSPKGARDAQIKRGDVLSFSDPGAPPLDLEDAGKLARFIRRDALECCDLAVRHPRRCVVQRR